MIRPIFSISSLVLASSLAACSAERPPVDDFTPQGPLVDAGTTVTKPDAGDASVLPEAGSGDADAKDASTDAEAGPISFDPDAICPSTITLGAGTLLPSSTAGDDLGLSVTLDGLSAAWTTKADATVTIHYVDRATTAEAFGPERVAAGAFGGARVALQKDGLGLAIVDADGLGFSYFSRASRAESFGGPSTGPFETLATQGIEELAPLGERFDNPVFARDDMYLVYTRVGPTSSRTFVSTRFSTNAPFAGGAPFAEAALGGSGGQRRVVTGVSEDVRTLFVWDVQAEKSRIVALNASSLVASDVELGTMRDVQPSTDCKTFWFGASGDLFTYVHP